MGQENLCGQHTGHEGRIKRNEEDIVNIYNLIEKVRNRLPNWATIVLMLLMGVCGWLLSFALKG